MSICKYSEQMSANIHITVGN